LQCDHRWTIGKESKLDSSNKDTLKELGGASETSDPSNLQRITEEDFTSQPSFSQNVPTLDESISGTNVLSSAHSESVDSGVSSVHSVGQDEKEETPGSVQRSLIHLVFGGKMTTTYKYFLGINTIIIIQILIDKSCLFYIFKDVEVAQPNPYTRTSLLISTLHSQRLRLHVLLPN